MSRSLLTVAARGALRRPTCWLMVLISLAAAGCCALPIPSQRYFPATPAAGCDPMLHGAPTETMAPHSKFHPVPTRPVL